MHIIVLILKIIGILLLSILGLLLLILALILLVPVRYQASMQKTSPPGEEAEKMKGLDGWMNAVAETFRADGKISWLLGLITLLGEYNGAQMNMDVRILGHSLLHKKPKKRKKKQKIVHTSTETEIADWADEETKKPDGTEELEEADEELGCGEAEEIEKPDGTEEMEEADEELGCDEAEEIDMADRSMRMSDDVVEDSKIAGFGRKIQELIARFVRMPEKLRQKIRKLGNKINSFSGRMEHLNETCQIYLDFWRKTCTQAAKDHVLKELKYLLRHTLPRKAEGTLTFGFEDPATTGQVLGILCVMAVFTGNHLEVNGEFERSTLEGELMLRGHIRLCHMVKSGVSLLIDKNIRKTIKAFHQIK